MTALCHERDAIGMGFMDGHCEFRDKKGQLLGMPSLLPTLAFTDLFAVTLDGKEEKAPVVCMAVTALSATNQVQFYLCVCLCVCVCVCGRGVNK